jgi:hypothetical protein
MSQFKGKKDEHGVEIKQQFRGIIKVFDGAAKKKTRSPLTKKDSPERSQSNEDRENGNLSRLRILDPHKIQFQEKVAGHQSPQQNLMNQTLSKFQVLADAQKQFMQLFHKKDQSSPRQ